MSRGLIWVLAIGGLLLVGLAEGQPPAPGTAGPALDKATLTQVRKLQVKRRDLLRDALNSRVQLYLSPRLRPTTLVEVVAASKRLLAAELELAVTGAERIAAYERHLELAQTLVGTAKSRLEAAQGTIADMLDAQAGVLEAQIGLLKAGGKLKKDKRAAEPMLVLPPPEKLEKLSPPKNLEK